MRREFKYHSATISYTRQGKGKPIVLLHGFGEDSSVWNEQVLFLQKHCLLIIPDLPGSGNSSLIQVAYGIKKGELRTTRDASLQTADCVSPGDISIEDYADCIYALLIHESIDSCTMLGHSMGGYITLAFAEKYPSMLNGFGLIHSTAFADTEEKKKNREKSIALIETHGALAFLRNTTPNLFGTKFKSAHPEKINNLIQAGTAFSKDALQQYTRAMMLRPDRTKVLLSNRLPVIFVIGTEDIAAPLEDVIKQVSLPNISYIHVLQHTGHMGMWEAPELLNQHVLAFIDRTQ